MSCHLNRPPHLAGSENLCRSGGGSDPGAEKLQQACSASSENLRERKPVALNLNFGQYIEHHQQQQDNDLHS